MTFHISKNEVAKKQELKMPKFNLVLNQLDRLIALDPYMCDWIMNGIKQRCWTY